MLLQRRVPAGRIIYISIRLFSGVTYEGGEERKTRRGVSEEQPFSDKPPLIQRGENYHFLTVVIKFNYFRDTAKSFVLKRWKKIVLQFALLN